MRSPVWFALAVLCMVMLIGCGGDPVDALLKEEKAMREAAKDGKLDPAKVKALERKLGALSQAQQEEYTKRKLNELLKTKAHGSP